MTLKRGSSQIIPVSHSLALRSADDVTIDWRWRLNDQTIVTRTRVKWYLTRKAPFTQGCDLRATLSDHKNGQDAQWSPKPRKFCFCVTAEARPLCLPWTTKSAVMAQQVAQRRQSGGRTIAKVAEGLPWSPNGGTVDATVIAQWTLSVGQRRHNGGTRKAEALLKLIHNVHNCTYF